jgi:hypothetical protein
VLSFALLAVVFALELPFVLWRVLSPAMTLVSPLLCIAMLLGFVHQRRDTPAGRKWFWIALTLLCAYTSFAIVVALRVPGGWNSLPEATGALVTVVLAVIGMVVLLVRAPMKPPPDPNRTLIQTWRARFH